MSLPRVSLEVVRDTVRSLETPADAAVPPLRWHAMLKLTLSELDWHKAESARWREEANARALTVREQRAEIERLSGLLEIATREAERALERTAD